MYADDHRDKITGVGRQFRAMAGSALLDPEDLSATFGTIRTALTAAEGQAVANLRRQGHSWATIGKALGMTAQAAHKRFRHDMEAWNDSEKVAS